MLLTDFLFRSSSNPPAPPPVTVCTSGDEKRVCSRVREIPRQSANDGLRTATAGVLREANPEWTSEISSGGVVFFFYRCFVYLNFPRLYFSSLCY